MPQANTGFASVKLPTALVNQARDAAQPMRRSVAGQVEYWATLGRIVEHSGLTAQEAQTAIATYEALTDLAGTGYWRYRAFQHQTGEFKTAIHDFFGPKVHRREPITLADYNRLPRFYFREEPTRVWATRVGAGAAGVLLLTLALGGWTWRRLRPARAGFLAS